jgi:hypothetical protein
MIARCTRRSLTVGIHIMRFDVAFGFGIRIALSRDGP